MGGIFENISVIIEGYMLWTKSCLFITDTIR